MPRGVRGELFRASGLSTLGMLGISSDMLGVMGAGLAHIGVHCKFLNKLPLLRNSNTLLVARSRISSCSTARHCPAQNQDLVFRWGAGAKICSGFAWFSTNMDLKELSLSQSGTSEIASWHTHGCFLEPIARRNDQALNAGEIICAIISWVCALSWFSW